MLRSSEEGAIPKGLPRLHPPLPSTQWQLLVINSSCFSFPGVSFNSVYTQIWRVLLHLAADPYPDVSDLAMKVLNSIAYKVRVKGGLHKALKTLVFSYEYSCRELQAHSGLHHGLETSNKCFESRGSRTPCARSLR